MKSKFDAPNEILTIESKITALAHLLESYQPPVPAEESDFYGLGLILRDLNADLSKIRNKIEQSNPQFGQTKDNKLDRNSVHPDRKIKIRLNGDK